MGNETESTEQAKRKQTMLVVSLPKGEEGKRLKGRLQAIANGNMRSLSNQIYLILMEYVQREEGRTA